LTGAIERLIPRNTEVVSWQLAVGSKRRKKSRAIKNKTGHDALYRELSVLKTCLNHRFTLMKMMALIKTI
jgi:hypothetical protein